MKEIPSNVILKSGTKRPSSYPLPKNICVIEDEGDCTFKFSREEVQNLNHNLGEAYETYAMPSFNLLDEDLEEGEPAVEAEDDDDCKIITERTVFDHIREKSKNFPVLAASNNPCSPLPETLLLIRKRTREKQLTNDVIEISEEKGRNKTPRRTMVTSSSEPKVEPLNDSGKLPLEHEESVSRTVNGGKIFEHIRNKAKSFPEFGNFKTLESKALSNTTELLPEDQSVFRSEKLKQIKLKKPQQDAVIVLDLDLGELENTAGGKNNASTNGSVLFGSSYCKAGELVSSPNVFISGSPSSNIPLLKREHWLENVYVQSNGKQFYSPSSSTKSGEVREADSFFGFKSVFSFL